MAPAEGVDARAGGIRVSLAWSPREGEACERELSLAAGATVLDAIRAADLMQGDGGVDVSTQAVGIWGRVVPLDATLGEGDRVEVYRAPAVNAKEARRRRAAGR